MTAHPARTAPPPPTVAAGQLLQPARVTSAPATSQEGTGSSASIGTRDGAAAGLSLASSSCSSFVQQAETAVNWFGSSFFFGSHLIYSK